MCHFERCAMSIKEIIGFVLFSLGIVTADSNSLIVPMALLITGAFLMRGTFTKG